MTDATFGDPPIPPEPGEGRLRAQDLIGHYVILHPTAEGEWPAREAEGEKKAQGPRPYVECDVWQLDRAGIVTSASGVRVSWWRVVEQLRNASHSHIVGKPVTQEDRSVILTPPSDECRKVVEQVKPDVLKGIDTPTDLADHSSEPF